MKKNLIYFLTSILLLSSPLLAMQGDYSPSQEQASNPEEYRFILYRLWKKGAQLFIDDASLSESMTNKLSLEKPFEEIKGNIKQVIDSFQKRMVYQYPHYNDTGYLTKLIIESNSYAKLSLPTSYFLNMPHYFEDFETGIFRGINFRDNHKDDSPLLPPSTINLVLTNCTLSSFTFARLLKGLKELKTLDISNTQSLLKEDLKLVPKAVKILTYDVRQFEN